MRFLVDESCDAAVLRALREAGWDLAARIAANLVALVKEHGESLVGSFVVIRPGSARILTPPFPA